MKGNGPALMGVVPTMCRKEFRGVVVVWAGGTGGRLRDLAKTVCRVKGHQPISKGAFPPVLLRYN